MSKALAQSEQNDAINASPIPSDHVIPAVPAGSVGPQVASTAPLPPLPEDPASLEPSLRTPFRTFTILIALYLTLFIAALDQTIIATAIPTITASLDSASGYTWIGGAYLIANAAAGPIWTKLSDIWGRKPLLLGSVAWFFGASVVCAEVCVWDRVRALYAQIMLIRVSKGVQYEDADCGTVSREISKYIDRTATS